MESAGAKALMLGGPGAEPWRGSPGGTAPGGGR